MATSLERVGADGVDLLLIVAGQLANVLEFGDLAMLAPNNVGMCGRARARQGYYQYEADNTKSKQKMQLCRSCNVSRHKMQVVPEYYR